MTTFLAVIGCYSARCILPAQPMAAEAVIVTVDTTEPSGRMGGLARRQMNAERTAISFVGEGSVIIESAMRFGGEYDHRIVVRDADGVDHVLLIKDDCTLRETSGSL